MTEPPTGRPPASAPESCGQGGPGPDARAVFPRTTKNQADGAVAALADQVQRDVATGADQDAIRLIPRGEFHRPAPLGRLHGAPGVPRRVAAEKTGFQAAPFAAGTRASVAPRGSAVSLNCPPMGRTYLSTTQGTLRTPMNSSRYRDLQFGLGDGEPTRAAQRMLRERWLPRQTAGPLPHGPTTARLLYGPRNARQVSLGQEPSIPGCHASAVPPEDISAGHDHEGRPPPAAKNPLVSPPPLAADHRHSVPLERLIGPTARRATPIRKANQHTASHHPDQRQHARQPKRVRIRPGFDPRPPDSKTDSS